LQNKHEVTQGGESPNAPAVGVCALVGDLWRYQYRCRDFSCEDRVEAAKYNLIQWRGLIGENVAYPAVRDGRDLSKNREALLKHWRESRFLDFTKNSSSTQTGGGN
jgi:hypothetical protein